MLSLLLLLSPSASAKDLRTHLGVGVHQPVDFGVPGASLTMLSFRYGLPLSKPTQNLILELDGGLRVNASEGTAGFGGGLKVMYALVVEDNLNFYGSIYGGAQQEVGGNAGGRVEPAVGVEFFPFGLDNLGIGVDWGLRMDLGATLRFATGPGLDVHYYF